MDTTVKRKPRTMAELLPGLGGLLSVDAMKSVNLTATKKPRPTIANTRTTEKVLKPLTIAEMFADFRTLQSKSQKNKSQAMASVKKKWNSSCKLENKTVSHTANGQMKHNTVRKVLNFQPPKPKVVQSITNSRMTMMNAENPKISKPEIRAKKPLYLQARDTVRISGIANIPQTPVTISKPIKSRMAIANKENVKPPVYKKLVATPKSTLRKKVLASRIPDTPLSNESWKSSCDASFLQNEQDIDYIENKAKVLYDEQTLDTMSEVSPPVSTPFTEYQNVKDYFNSTHDVMENTYHDNTIMSFDNTISKENSKSEESVIGSLCNMLSKATVSSEQHTDLEHLLKVQKQIENNIQMTENGIRTLKNIKESQIKSLEYVKKLIQEKTKQESDIVKENITTKVKVNKSETLSKPCSVIKVNLKSPAYKIPKKNSCIKKKVCYKSMPNIPETITPQKDMGGRALSMYLKMKECNNYLTTPLVKQRPAVVLDTPATTSRNLQQQLDRLYGES